MDETIKSFKTANSRLKGLLEAVTKTRTHTNYYIYY